LPQVVIPVAGDQPANGAESERLGVGISVPFRDVTEENLSSALRTVLTDPSYLKASAELGGVLVDQINRPLDRAVWWIEHVMRHPTLYKR
jgi:glucuronosyltransferase